MNLQSYSMKKPTYYLLPVLLCLICSFSTSSSAQEKAVKAEVFDAKFYNQLEWRNIGPKRGGRSLGVAGSPGRPHEYYFGATGGGLWKTIDGGTEWFPVTDGQVTSSSVGAVAVAETATEGPTLDDGAGSTPSLSPPLP